MAAHFRRRLQLLELIPRGRKVSASELRRRLEDRGFRVNLHTVQRDLAEFEQVRLIDGDGAKPEGWQWNRLLPPRLIPAMSPLTALALYLVAQAHVRRWPPVLGRQLQSQLAMAEQVLAGCDGGSVSRSSPWARSGSRPGWTIRSSPPCAKPCCIGASCRPPAKVPGAASGRPASSTPSVW